MALNHAPNARQQKILDHVNAQGSVQIREFAEVVQVSEATVRRDLDELARMGLVSRVHGGAVRVTSTSFERANSEKMGLNLNEKLQIAAYAASLVENGDSVFLDSGTTTYFIARELTHHKNLTILTNNLDIAQSLHFDPTVSVIVTGGLLREQYSVLIGNIAEQIISSFRNHTAGIGHSGVSIGALGLRHGLEHIHAAVDGVGFAQLQCKEVLMNIGELIVEIQQVLVLRTIADDGGRKFFSAVERVIQRESQTPLANVLVFRYIVNIVNKEHIREVGNDTGNQGTVTGGKNGCLSAVLHLAVALLVRVQAGNGIALGLIGFRKFLDILSGSFGSLLRGVTDGNRGRPGLVINFSAAGQFLDIIGVKDIVHISEGFVPALLVGYSGIALHLGVIGVSRKDVGSVHQRINKYHDENHDANGG